MFVEVLHAALCKSHLKGENLKALSAKSDSDVLGGGHAKIQGSRETARERERKSLELELELEFLDIDRHGGRKTHGTTEHGETGRVFCCYIRTHDCSNLLRYHILT